MDIHKILEERKGTHGDFEKVSNVAQAMKESLSFNNNLNRYERESAEMICTKLARIVCGNADEIDHWSDIAGYATLVVRELEKLQPAKGGNANGLR